MVRESWRPETTCKEKSPDTSLSFLPARGTGSVGALGTSPATIWPPRTAPTTYDLASTMTSFSALPASLNRAAWS